MDGSSYEHHMLMTVETRQAEASKKGDDGMSRSPMVVDEILRRVGEFGRFQWFLEVVFVVMHMPVVYQVLAMYFVALEPSWKCARNSTVCTMNGTFTSENEHRCQIPRSEWIYTERADYSIATQFDMNCSSSWTIYMSTSMMFIGQIFGSVILGHVSDKYGRKLVLFPLLAVIMTSTLLCTAAPNIAWFLFFRFVIGFASKGITLEIVVLLSEFVSTKYRSTAINTIWIFWTATLCLLALQAYLITDWKTLFIVISAPYYFVLLAYKFVPESVRWLRLMNHLEQLQKTFVRVAKWNGRVVNEQDILVTALKRNRKKVTPWDLFRTKTMVVNMVVLGFGWFVNGLVYYGISLAADELGGSVYLNFVLVTLVEFPAGLMALDFADRFGRRKTTAFAMLAAGLLCSLVPFIPLTEYGRPTRVVIGMLGKLFVTLSFDVIVVWSLEILTTDMRTTGIGMLTILMDAGSASSPWIAKGLKVVHTSVPFAVMGVLTVLGGLVAFVLPETNGKDTLDCAEEDVVETNTL